VAGAAALIGTQLSIAIVTFIGIFLEFRMNEKRDGFYFRSRLSPLFSMSSERMSPR